MRGGFLPQQMLGDVRHPRAGRVHQRIRGDRLAISPRIEHELPEIAGAVGAHEPRAGADDGAALGRIDRVEHHEPRIVDPAVRIDEALAVLTLQRLADRIVREIDHLGAGQDVASAEDGRR